MEDIQTPAVDAVAALSMESNGLGWVGSFHAADARQSSGFETIASYTLSLRGCQSR